MVQRGRKKGETILNVIGEFDKNFRLAVDSHSFVIQERAEREKRDGTTEEVWTSKYWYANLTSCFQGYAKHLARRTKSNKFISLKSAFENWEKAVETAAERLEARFGKEYFDKDGKAIHKDK